MRKSRGKKLELQQLRQKGKERKDSLEAVTRIVTRRALPQPKTNSAFAFKRRRLLVGQFRVSSERGHRLLPTKSPANLS